MVDLVYTNLDNLEISNNLIVDGTLTAASIIGTIASNSAVVATPDNGTTQTLTAAMVSGGGAWTFHTSTGGSTPTLTMPLATTLIAAISGWATGDSYVLRIINLNSGTTTVAGNTGLTLTGTATISTNGQADFVITKTGAAAVTMVRSNGSATTINGLSITASTGTLTVPNAVTFTGPPSSGTAATLAGSETLSNKSLTSAAATGNFSLSTTSFVVGSSTDSITAHSGGGSGSATAIVSQTNRVATVAADHDSVKLPTSVGGMEVLIDNDATKIVDVYPAGSDTIEDSANPYSIPGGADVTFISPVAGKWYVQGSIAAPITVGSSYAITSALNNVPLLLNTAGGSAATLPAATGSGNTYKFFVTTTTTSGTHKILAASSSDFMNGIVTGNTNSSGTAKCFASAAATNHSLQMPFAGSQPSGGFIGDWFELTDVATNLWSVKGMYGAGTTPTTPFSSATS